MRLVARGSNVSPVSHRSDARFAALAALVLCACHPPRSVGQATPQPPCGPGAHGAVQTVQRSEAYLVALDAVGLGPSVLCDELVEMPPLHFGGTQIRLVQVLAPMDPAMTELRFGVDPQGKVAFLEHVEPISPFQNGMEPRLDLDQWNTLVEGAHPRHRLTDSAEVRRYGCALLDLNNFFGEDTSCDGTSRVELWIRPDAFVLRVTTGNYHRTVAVRPDWSVLALDVKVT